MKISILLAICLLSFSLAIAQTDSDAVKTLRRDLTEHTSVRVTMGEAYPNPARADVTIDYVVSPNVHEAKLTVYNMLGANVAEYELNKKESNIEISVANLKDGVYFYSVSADGHKEQTRRLVVRR
ncbi:MAG: T9SS type A sorting domain-containing protein [Bacteroidota bacterium]